MTIKSLAFDAQQYLESQTGTTFKRGHIYELLAASLGFNSYASLCADHVFTHGSITSKRPAKHSDTVGRRCLELSYPPETALGVARVLPAHLSAREIGAIRITDLVAHLRYETHGVPTHDFDEFDDEVDNEDEGSTFDPWFDRASIASPILLEGLTAAAEKGDANAHYALALIHAPSDDPFDKPSSGSEYWYNEGRNGRVLTGVEKEWADAYSAALHRDGKYEHHLRAAGALGHEAALLEMAEQFGDPAFFEQGTTLSSSIDAAYVADLAEQLGRPNDAWRYWTIAAQQGNTEAMRELIEGHDRLNLRQCWTWFYLAKLLGTDLSENEYRLINEDGSDYDDDVGGPAEVIGQDGVVLEAINGDQNAAAQRAAATLYQAIEASYKG